MKTPEIMFLLFAILIVLIFSAWDFVCDEWSNLQTSHKWVVGTSIALLFGLVFLRGIVPVVWKYGNLILNF